VASSREAARYIVRFSAQLRVSGGDTAEVLFPRPFQGMVVLRFELILGESGSFALMLCARFAATNATPDPTLTANPR